MKKIFTLALALVAVMAMDAKKVVFDFTDPASLGITPSTEKSKGVELPADGVTVDDITLTSVKVQKNPNVLFTKSDGASYELRTYNQNTITFVSAGDNITAIEFAGDAVAFAEFTGKSWTGDTDSVTFTGTGSSKITTITLTVGEAAVVWTPDTVSVTEAIALADAKDAHDHYVIGVVMGAPFITYNNFNGHASFWLSDVANPSDSIELYDGYAQGNAKWASLEAAQEAIHGGDTVLVYAGALSLYAAKNFYEITGGYFAEMLGANPNPVDPNAFEIPEGYITCAAAMELAAGLADPTADNKTVKGETVKICAAVTYAYPLADGKQSAWLDDKKSGSGLIQASYLATSAEVAKGDIVLIEGTIAKYYKMKDGEFEKIIIEVVDGTMVKQGAEGIENVQLTEKAQKVMVDGVIYIIRDNKMYNVQGTQVR